MAIADQPAEGMVDELHRWQLHGQTARVIDALAAALATRHRIAAKRVPSGGASVPQALETVPNQACGNHQRVLIKVKPVGEDPGTYAYTDAETGRNFGTSNDLVTTAKNIALAVRTP